MNTGDTLEGERHLLLQGLLLLTDSWHIRQSDAAALYLAGQLLRYLARLPALQYFHPMGLLQTPWITHVIGDVGTNVGLTTGFNPLVVTGTIDTIPNGATAACGADFLMYIIIWTQHIIILSCCILLSLGITWYLHPILML